jgi:hypothetical protein
LLLQSDMTYVATLPKFGIQKTFDDIPAHWTVRRDEEQPSVWYTVY